MRGEIFEDGKRGHREDLFFAHQAHGFVAELQGVIDGGDSGLRSVERARFAHGVNGDATSCARSFVNCGDEFFFSVLIGREKAAVDDLVGAGFINFDEVGAFF